MNYVLAGVTVGGLGIQLVLERLRGSKGGKTVRAEPSLRHRRKRVSSSGAWR